MFGEILKASRKRANLTQNDAVRILHLAYSEFLSVDNVTISRWERGVTAPTLVRKIRILRALNINVLELIHSIGNTSLNPKGTFQDVRFFRFREMPKSKLYVAAQDTEGVVVESCISKGTEIFVDPVDEFLKNTHDSVFLNGFGNKNKNEVISELYRDDNGNVLGHYAYFYINDKKKGSRYISPKEMIKYNDNYTMSLFIFSMYSENESIYKATLKKVSLKLAEQCNIKHVYLFCKWQETKKYLSNIGAEVFYYIDGTRVIFRIEAALWLSQPEIVSLLKNE